VAESVTQAWESFALIALASLRFVTALSNVEGAVTRPKTLNLQSCPASNLLSGRCLPSSREGGRNLVSGRA